MSPPRATPCRPHTDLEAMIQAWSLNTPGQVGQANAGGAPAGPTWGFL